MLAVCWTSRDALFGPVQLEQLAQVKHAVSPPQSPEKTKLLPITSHVSHATAHTVQNTAKIVQSAAHAPEAAHTQAQPTASKKPGDKNRAYISSIGHSISDKIKAFIHGGEKNSKATTGVHVVKELRSRSDVDLDDLANQLLKKQMNSSMSHAQQAKALVGTLRQHHFSEHGEDKSHDDAAFKKFDRYQNHGKAAAQKSGTDTHHAGKSTPHTAQSQAEEDKKMDEKAQQMYESMRAKKIQKKQEEEAKDRSTKHKSSKVSKPKASTHTKETIKQKIAKEAQKEELKKKAAEHDAKMDAMAQKMFTAYQKKKQAGKHVVKPPGKKASPKPPPKLAPEEAKPPPKADSDTGLAKFEPPPIKRPAALEGKSDADLDAMAESMMKKMSKGGPKGAKAKPTAAMAVHARMQQLWSASEDVDENAEAAKDAKLLKKINAPTRSLVKDTGRHHTVAFNMKALLGGQEKDCDKKHGKKPCKKKSVDQLAQEMMKKLDEKHGKLGKVKAVTVAGAMGLPPDIAASISKLKKSEKKT
jgi:hypothetical protein